jgi:hypothetical protein
MMLAREAEIAHNWQHSSFSSSSEMPLEGSS